MRTLNLKKTLGKAALLTGSSLLFLGCGGLRKYERPADPIAEDAAFVLPEQGFSAVEPVADWWSQVPDERVHDLVSDAFAYNHDLRMAMANLRASRELARARGYDRFPTVTLSGSATTERTSEEVAGTDTGLEYEAYSVGLTGSWELDLFGRVSQKIAVARADLAVSEADLRNVYVTVAADVVQAYIDLRGAQARLAVAEKNLGNQEETVSLTRSLVDAGRGSELDVARARAQLESTRASLPTIRGQVDVALSQLALLTGRLPDALDETLGRPAPIPSIPPTIAVGNPGDLLRRRPDVAAAEQQLAKAVAIYNIETTDLFPQVSILGSLGFLSTSLSDLLTGDALTWSFGPTITWSALDIGRQKAEMRAADASADAALAQYEKSVLTALKDVDDALSRFSHESERRVGLQEAVKAAADAVRLARVRYDAGLESFLPVLDAERTLLLLETQLASSDEITAGRLVAVYRALGGGWEGQPTRLDQEEEAE